MQHEYLQENGLLHCTCELTVFVIIIISLLVDGNEICVHGGRFCSYVHCIFTSVKMIS